jgi:hypothetical protein
LEERTLALDIPIIPGGNGGPGGSTGDYGTGTNYGGPGALGGGVIYLIAPKIVINPGGEVITHGRQGHGQIGSQYYASGAGGGGGGGMSVFICQQGAGSMLNNSSIDTDTNAAWSSWSAGHWYSASGGSGGAAVGGWEPRAGGNAGTQMIRVIQPDGSVRLAH